MWYLYPMTTVDMVLRLLAGFGFGAIIGFERQYRARMAGLRTNTLVSVGSTLFVLLSEHGFHGSDADPTRVAAQIVSGIGFLGAGVIMRDGFTVRGLNTAATLWCSAAVGALAGTGQFQIATLGTVAVVVINIVLRYVGRVVDRRPDTGNEHPVTYTFLATTHDDNEAEVRGLLVRAFTSTDFRLVSVESVNAAQAGKVEVRVDLAAEERDDTQMETAISRLSLEPAVTSVRWQVHDEDLRTVPM
jgi:putative Mg2+ transporter-C (MgtC) family protein